MSTTRFSSSSLSSSSFSGQSVQSTSADRKADINTNGQSGSVSNFTNAIKNNDVRQLAIQSTEISDTNTRGVKQESTEKEVEEMYMFGGYLYNLKDYERMLWLDGEMSRQKRATPVSFFSYPDVLDSEF